MIKVTITTKTGEQKEVNIRKTLAGDLMLREHPEIDIIVMPEKAKVLVLPKDEQTDHIYKLQEKLFKYMIQKDRKSTRLNSSHVSESRMPSSA